MHLYELKYTEIQNKQADIVKLFPSFVDRKKKVKSNGGATLVSQEKGIFEFLVASGTKKGKHYAIRIKFNGIEEAVAQAAKDPNNWTTAKDHLNLTRVATYVLYNTDLQTSSDSPGDQFWGPNYQKTKVDAELDNPENRPPDVRNPGQYGIVGKHLSLVLDRLPLLVSKMAEHLKKFFLPEIVAIEKESIGTLYGKKKEYTPEEEQEINIPKQGTKEKERRKAQIAKGTLQPTSVIEKP